MSAARVLSRSKMVMGRAPEKGIQLRWNKYKLTTSTALGGLLFCNKGLHSELRDLRPYEPNIYTYIYIHISAYELKSKLFKGAI